jgi:tRNA(His) 5'-end guanylyltransferase
MSEDSLGDRMKHNYEERARHYLLRRTPVIVRVDGKAFHTFTANFNKPFDMTFIECMVVAAKAVAKELQGFKVGYIQSDEASFLLTDYDDLNTDAWFDLNVQKVASVTSSLMTYCFNKVMPCDKASIHQPVVFDARCFNIPKEEIANYFLWRAKDWERNSVSMFARAFFSQKELHGKGRADIHEMLHQKGQNWANLDPICKNGTFLIKDTGVISYKYNIQATYEDINKLVCRALKPKEE